MAITESALCALAVQASARSSVLDIGCGSGATLARLSKLRPDLALAGVDISLGDLTRARSAIPSADLRLVSATKLPFPDQIFDVVLCMEVIEHVPPDRRKVVLAEAHRVAKAGACLVVSTPHAGWFQSLDGQNLRYRFPRLHRLMGGGARDRNYAAKQPVVWHHHFTTEELVSLLGDWKLTTIRYQGLVLVPLMDLLAYGFHRRHRQDHSVFRAMSAVAAWEARHDFGPRASYGICVTAKR
jgi:ubiquinone/menaquinone biosynthesis C-methylase UbiE